MSNGKKLCPEPAAYRLTWPERQSEMLACITHAMRVKRMMDAIGGNIALTPLTAEEIIADDQCFQEV